MPFHNPFRRQSSSQGYRIPTIPSLILPPQLTKPEDRLQDNKCLDRPLSSRSPTPTTSSHVLSRDFAPQQSPKPRPKAKGKAPADPPSWILDAEAEISRLERNSASIPPSPNPARSSSSPLLPSRPQSKDKSTRSRPTSASISSSPILYRPESKGIAKATSPSKDDDTEPSPRPASRGRMHRLSSWASTTLSRPRSRRNTDSSYSSSSPGAPQIVSPLTPIIGATKLGRKQRRERKRQEKWEREQERRAEEMIERYSSSQEGGNRSQSESGLGGVRNDGKGNGKGNGGGGREDDVPGGSGGADVVGWW